MNKIFATIAVFQGIFIVGGLLLLRAIVQAFIPTFVLPFSIWWGLVIAIPTFVILFFFHKASKF